MFIMRTLQCPMDAIFASITVVPQFYVYKAFSIFSIVDDKTQTLNAKQEKEMSHTLVSVRNQDG